MYELKNIEDDIIFLESKLRGCFTLEAYTQGVDQDRSVKRLICQLELLRAKRDALKG